MGFFEGGLARLAASVLTKDVPAYVQFYVTARCNLRCEQCNIIYANADQRECSTEQCGRIAENLAEIGTSVVLLTGGEPFVRKDIVEIARAFLSHRIHPRIQTNGLASRGQIEAMAAIGAHDISISLDTLVPEVQDAINGGVRASWKRAMRTISVVNEVLPPNSFCVFGCVLAPRNIDHITGVIRFATAIGWWVSLVPAHVASRRAPRGFRTFDPRVAFEPEDYGRVARCLAEARRLRNEGFNVYDADEYLDDVCRIITGEAPRWRRRNGGVCDSPNLYFAVEPDGQAAVCCDYRLPQAYPVYDREFPRWYRSREFRAQVRQVTERCPGCMYGSFPEISISARFLTPMVRRAVLFLREGPQRELARHSPEELTDLAQTIAREEGIEVARG